MINEKEFRLNDPELEGEIYYLTAQEGGRYNNVKSGYRGQFYYNGKDWDAPQEFIGKEICSPGETVKVRLQTLSPDFHVGQLCIGQKFETREGARTVGKGKITRILRQDFNYWDFDSFFSQIPNDCKPYDFKSIENFVASLKSVLGDMKQIGDLKFTKTPLDKIQMLTVEFKLRDKSISGRSFTDNFCEKWREEIQVHHSLYRINLDLSSGFKFELTFAIWNSIYLTGKIIVDIAK